MSEANGASVRCVIGVDIGGTFTDCAVVAADGMVWTGKAPTTPDDRSVGFFDAIGDAAGKLGVTLDELLAGCERLVHGTTAGTNALITRSGSKVGLITTAGHGDMVGLMKASGRLAGLPPEQVLDIPRTGKPPVLVPKSLIAEVVERIDFEGDIVVPLNEDSVRERLQPLLDAGVESIAVSLLWSMRNTEHEERIVEIVRAAAPDLFVSRASRLSVRIGEYERTNTCLINSYIGPLMNRYVQAIEDGAAARGYAGRVLYAQCAGGAVTAGEAQEAPVRTVHSGPVSGALGSAYLAKQMGEPNLIVTDMGGTSFDVSVVRDGSLDLRDVSMLERLEIALPMVYVDTIGAGGGSIAWIDEAGGLQVGPRSAGAVPGPACYDQGGTEATVTDADVVLGIIDPDNFLHGAMRLNRQAAEEAVGRIGDALGLGLHEAAAGINRIIDSKMANLVRRMSVLRGLDPRDFVCFAYGGSGPAHAGALASDIGVKQLIVPLLHAAPVWSAFGAATADVVHVKQRWHTVELPSGVAPLTEIFEQLEREAYAALLADGFDADRVALQRSVYMKYRAQIHEVEVPVDERPLTDADVLKIEDDFQRVYDELHGAGAGYREGGSKVTGFTVRARGLVDRFDIGPVAVGADATWGARPVYWPEEGGFVETPVVRMTRGRLEEQLTGPVLLELPDTVVVVRPGQVAEFDELGNLILRSSEASAP